MIYLDNAATTYPKPEEVYSFADRFYRENGVYNSRGQYKMSKKVNILIDDTKEKLLELFNARGNHKVVFTPSATIAINTILNGLSYNRDMNICITHFEHNAVLRKLSNIKQQFNLNIIKLYTNTNNLLYNINYIKERFVTPLIL